MFQEKLQENQKVEKVSKFFQFFCRKFLIFFEAYGFQKGAKTPKTNFTCIKLSFQCSHQA